MDSSKIFGMWDGFWGWRVEWYEGGTLHSKTFVQKDLQPGVAKAEADAFATSLSEMVA